MDAIALAVIGGTGVYKLADLRNVETQTRERASARPPGRFASARCMANASLSWRGMAKAIRSPPTRSTTAPIWPRCRTLAPRACWR